MSYLLIEGLRFIKELGERNPERLISVDEIAAQLEVSAKTIRYYVNDFVDTRFVEIITVDGKEHLRALPEFLKADYALTKYTQGATKSDNKAPYSERIPIKCIRQFYDVAKKQSRRKEEEEIVRELSRRILDIGRRTTVYSRGSAGKWLRCLDDLREAASIPKKIVAIDSIMSFIHGRGRIPPLMIQAKRSDILRLLDSIAKE